MMEYVGIPRRSNEALLCGGRIDAALIGRRLSVIIINSKQGVLVHPKPELHHAAI